MIFTENLQYKFDNGKTIGFPNIKVEEGQSCLILGKSGIGKTTLLHLMALILKPNIGSIQINNQETSRLTANEIVKFRANNIGTVFQKPHFVKALTVHENIVLSCFLANKKVDKNQLEQLVNTLNIAEIINKKVTNLSLGEQQRVTIARALINNPKLILADEPSSSLDDENCKNVIDLLKTQANKIGASLVIVTHDQRLKVVFENQVTLI
jgi:ABC-type lipoprotein export system ATPase subunit